MFKPHEVSESNSSGIREEFREAQRRRFNRRLADYARSRSMDTILAYLISFAIIAFGTVWTFVSNAGSAVAPAWLICGIPTIVVGLVSLSLGREYGSWP